MTLHGTVHAPSSPDSNSMSKDRRRRTGSEFRKQSAAGKGKLGRLCLSPPPRAASPSATKPSRGSAASDVACGTTGAVVVGSIHRRPAERESAGTSQITQPN